MRLKLLRSVGWKDAQPRSAEYPTSLELPAKADGSHYREGDEVELSEDDAEKYIKAGIGEVVETKRPVAAAQPKDDKSK